MIFRFRHDELTHCGLVSIYGDITLCQDWLRWWIGAWPMWRHQAITCTNVDLELRSKPSFNNLPCYSMPTSWMDQLTECKNSSRSIIVACMWCWLNIKSIPWYSSKSNFTRSADEYTFRDYFWITKFYIFHEWAGWGWRSPQPYILSCTPGLAGHKMVPVHQNPGIKKITVAHQVKEQNYSLIMLFHQLNHVKISSLKFPAEADQHCMYTWTGEWVCLSIHRWSSDADNILYRD